MSDKKTKFELRDEKYGITASREKKGLEPVKKPKPKNKKDNKDEE